MANTPGPGVMPKINTARKKVRDDSMVMEYYSEQVGGGVAGYRPSTKKPVF
jgi:hypothetical protein